jgi:hypothetical protein
LEKALCERLVEKQSDLNVLVDLDWLKEEEEAEEEEEEEEQEEGTPSVREFLSFEGRAKQDNDRLAISLSLPSSLRLFLYPQPLGSRLGESGRNSPFTLLGFFVV